MKDYTDCRRGFHRSNKAWYGDIVEGWEIIFGMYHKDGSTSGSMSMTWNDLGSGMFPLLKVYDDAWSVLALFDDLILRLGEVDSENITEKQFAGILLECDFEDLTEYEHPRMVYEKQKKERKEERK